MRTSICATPGRLGLAAALATFGVLAATLVGCGSSGGSSGLPGGSATMDQVARGRYLVTTVGCTDCHNRGKDDPNDPNWLAGFIGNPGDQGPGAFQVGPFHTYAANITPDPTHGLGGFTDRQIYNALKYGLDPMETPDVVITSTTPGQGNFPSTPHYLAPPMPWPAFRHMSDSDLWAIVAYIKHGIKPNANQPPDTEEAPDFWASSYTPDKVGPVNLSPYPAAGEQPKF
jgi:mono/diheme cytochrome c family protein